MGSGLTPWLALELPSDPREITPEMLAEWTKKQELARLAATGCNVLYEELGMRRRMNFYHKFKKSSEWKNARLLEDRQNGERNPQERRLQVRKKKKNKRGGKETK
jgi:hypothetical protein